MFVRLFYRCKGSRAICECLEHIPDLKPRIGSGQPSRLDSCEIAIDKMNKFSKIKNDIVAASDAFFPFVDGVEKLVQSGVSAIIQPAGSIRDKEIIKFANETNTVLIFSKTRHFRH